MSLAARLLQRVGYARRDPLRRVALHAKRARDPVRGHETDAINVLRQPVRVLPYNRDRVVAVALIDLRRQTGADSVPLQKDHHLLDRLHLSPGRPDHRDPLAAHAADLRQPLRFAFDDVERPFAKMGHDPLGRHRPHASDQAAAKIPFDTGNRRRQHRPHSRKAELLAVLRVHLPVPLQLDRLSHVDADHVAHDRRLLLPVGQMASWRLQRQLGNRVAVLLVVECDALDHPAQRFLPVPVHGC